MSEQNDLKNEQTYQNKSQLKQIVKLKGQETEKIFLEVQSQKSNQKIYVNHKIKPDINNNSAKEQHNTQTSEINYNQVPSEQIDQQQIHSNKPLTSLNNNIKQQNGHKRSISMIDQKNKQSHSPQNFLNGDYQHFQNGDQHMQYNINHDAARKSISEIQNQISQYQMQQVLNEKKIQTVKKQKHLQTSDMNKTNQVNQNIHTNITYKNNSNIQEDEQSQLFLTELNNSKNQNNNNKQDKINTQNQINLGQLESFQQIKSQLFPQSENQEQKQYKNNNNNNKPQFQLQLDKNNPQQSSIKEILPQNNSQKNQIPINKPHHQQQDLSNSSTKIYQHQNQDTNNSNQNEKIQEKESNPPSKINKPKSRNQSNFTPNFEIKQLSNQLQHEKGLDLEQIENNNKLLNSKFVNNNYHQNEKEEFKDILDQINKEPSKNYILIQDNQNKNQLNTPKESRNSSSLKYQTTSNFNKNNIKRASQKDILDLQLSEYNNKNLDKSLDQMHNYNNPDKDLEVSNVYTKTKKNAQKQYQNIQNIETQQKTYIPKTQFESPQNVNLETNFPYMTPQNLQQSLRAGFSERGGQQQQLYNTSLYLNSPFNQIPLQNPNLQNSQIVQRARSLPKETKLQELQNNLYYHGNELQNFNQFNAQQYPMLQQNQLQFQQLLQQPQQQFLNYEDPYNTMAQDQTRYYQNLNHQMNVNIRKRNLFQSQYEPDITVPQHFQQQNTNNNLTSFQAIPQNVLNSYNQYQRKLYQQQIEQQQSLLMPNYQQHQFIDLNNNFSNNNNIVGKPKQTNTEPDMKYNQIKKKLIQNKKQNYITYQNHMFMHNKHFIKSPEDDQAHEELECQNKQKNKLNQPNQNYQHCPTSESSDTNTNNVSVFDCSLCTNCKKKNGITNKISKNQQKNQRSNTETTEFTLQNQIQQQQQQHNYHNEEFKYKDRLNQEQIQQKM